MGVVRLCRKDLAGFSRVRIIVRFRNDRYRHGDLFGNADAHQ
jgi:hypothetical protein